MDKNLVAFLDEQAYTIDVQFAATGKLYKYVTNLPAIELGSFVLIPGFGVDPDPNLVPSPTISSSSIKVAQVVGVHDGVKIEPNETIQYKWVIAKVDFTYFTDLCKRNYELQKLTEDAYKRNLRK